MGSNLKQEAMERVGEVEHAECYYDTDRNKPLPGRAAVSVGRNSVPSRDAIAGAVARGWCTPENASKTMDEAIAWAIIDELTVLLAAQAVPKLQRQAVATVVSRSGDDMRVGWLRPERCTVGTLLFCAVEPTDTTKGA